MSKARLMKRAKRVSSLIGGVWAGISEALDGEPLDVANRGARLGIVPDNGGTDDGGSGGDVAAGADPDGADETRVGIDGAVGIAPNLGLDEQGAVDGGIGLRPAADEMPQIRGDVLVETAIEHAAVDGKSQALVPGRVPAQAAPAAERVRGGLPEAGDFSVGGEDGAGKAHIVGGVVKSLEADEAIGVVGDDALAIAAFAVVVQSQEKNGRLDPV